MQTYRCFGCRRRTASPFRLSGIGCRLSVYRMQEAVSASLWILRPQYRWNGCRSRRWIRCARLGASSAATWWNGCRAIHFSAATQARNAFLAPLNALTYSFNRFPLTAAASGWVLRSRRAPAVRDLSSRKRGLIAAPEPPLGYLNKDILIGGWGSFFRAVEGCRRRQLLFRKAVFSI